MTAKNEQLFRAAQDAITALYSDTSVDKEKCAENLQTLIEELEMLIESLGDLA